MALWNVKGGTEPADFRRQLREALPNAPVKQIVAGPHTLSLFSLSSSCLSQNLL